MAIIAAIWFTGCGGPSLDEVEAKVAHEVGENVTCVEAGDRSYECSGDGGDYRARLSQDGSRVVVREPERRCNPAYGGC